MKRYADIGLRLPSASDRWNGAAFREELRAWVAGEVGEPTSLEPVKVRAWATVWRVETGSGVFYAKQNCSTQAYEAALRRRAQRPRRPARRARSTGVDLGRGLFLTPDLGPSRSVRRRDDVDAWCRVAAAGAQLQLEVARYTERLVAAGLTTLAPGDCVGYVEEQLDAFAALPDGRPARAAGRAA